MLVLRVKEPRSHSMRALYRSTHVAIPALARLIAGLRVRGLANLPSKPPFLVAANHISFLDPPLIGTAVPFECFYFAKVELFSNPIASAILRAYNVIPVRRGYADREALALGIKSLRAGHPLLIFPEGTRDRKARLRTPKRGLGFLAVQSGVPVVPTYIVGTNQFARVVGRRRRLEVVFGPILTHITTSSTEPASRRAAYDQVGQAWLAAMTTLEAEHLLP